MLYNTNYLSSYKYIPILPVSYLVMIFFNATHSAAYELPYFISLCYAS